MVLILVKKSRRTSNFGWACAWNFTRVGCVTNQRTAGSLRNWIEGGSRSTNIGEQTQILNHLKVLCLKGMVLNVQAKGSVIRSHVNVEKLNFTERVLLSHNHPSGTLNPSQADIDLTKKGKKPGSFLTFQFLITTSWPAKHIIHSLLKGSCSFFLNSFFIVTKCQ